ncbi:histone deacetylase HST2 KNAG_0D02670 [Huiozyma naganishii CBS 8797]|uniref:NAD-dependent protein deacetylase n=1 Tax=Huiozyma naganishii (strain ATCC MYA-139 / BCRC 22969 / CBS 8797 / KCTC 17520 / NBRC 10181 / NCYC 3082 / Yp74L-3) TaxID=1071383 RepID=J7S6Z8_HUIN7|nr:hypothetical protein KNAG_0D02670 [Kazachstania naganishii CBS 8797]CCK70016.1 hypothetical protein KNAG_0D02670 [Kazachstania naganishii CBS 8797]
MKYLVQHDDANLKAVKKLGFLLRKTSGANVIFMVGAGISTSCGIPDFRSPETGLYRNLAKLNLPFAEAVFDIDFFEENPKPFYTLAKELYPGKFKPSKFHFFMKLFQDENRLRRIYTQNIDTLEAQAGINAEYIVEAHGNFASNHCIKCKKQFPMNYFKEKLDFKTEDSIDFARCDHCKSLIKPNIVFFGENLPARFFDTWEDDLETLEDKSSASEYIVIVAGTSLAVYPFASLPHEVPAKIRRILINKEMVGSFAQEKRKTDLMFKGSTDDAAQRLAEEMGWSEKLKKLCNEFEIKQIDTKKEISEVMSEMKKLTINKDESDNEKPEAIEISEKLGKLGLSSTPVKEEPESSKKDVLKEAKDKTEPNEISDSLKEEASTESSLDKLEEHKSPHNESESSNKEEKVSNQPT